MLELLTGASTLTAACPIHRAAFCAISGLPSAEEPGPERAFFAFLRATTTLSRPTPRSPRRPPKPVKPPTTPIIAKPSITIGDLYFQNLA